MLVGLGLLCVSVVFIAAGTIVLALKSAAIGRRTLLIESHPTILALRHAGVISASLAHVPGRIQQSVQRFAKIANSLASIGSSAAVVSLNIERVAFATRMLLQTFVPTLRGAMWRD